uniref:Ig-like domain-containing protein n=1 Tax=Glossina brevipalpis TaxID=37001 RepID=A0A1A9WJ57_9MUSC
MRIKSLKKEDRGTYYCVADNGHYSIFHSATADEYSDSTLCGISIEKRQYGDYVCKAVNKLRHAGQGESVRNFYIYFDGAENPTHYLPQ